MYIYTPTLKATAPTVFMVWLQAWQLVSSLIQAAYK